VWTKSSAGELNGPNRMPTSYRWIVLAVAVFAFMQTHLHRMAFTPLIPRFVVDLGLTYAAAGAIQTSYLWSYAIAQIPVGIVADRWGTRPVMIVSTTLLALGALTFAASSGFAETVLARMVVGLGAAAIWVPAMRLIRDWFPSGELARAIGLLSGGGAIGGTAALLVIPALALRWDWRVAYGSTALPALVTIGLIALFAKPRQSASVTARGPKQHLRSLLGSRDLWPLNVAMFCSYGAYFSVLTYLPAVLVRQFGASEPQAGAVTALITFGSILSWPIAGFLSDHLRQRRPLFLVSEGVNIAVCLLFALAGPRLGLPGAAFVIAMMGLLLCGTILPSVIVVEVFPAELALPALGISNVACFVGGVAFTMLLGYLVDVTGGFAAMFVAAAEIHFAAFAVGIFLRETGTESATLAPPRQFRA
jgi:predicted MFS family arabinose efflux permease